MKSTDYLNQYKANGFVKLKNIFSDKDIEKILTELDEVKKILIKIKKKKIYHKTKDGKINTIHNIQEFYKKNKFQKIVGKNKLLNIVKKILGKEIKIKNIEFFLKPKKTGLPSPFHQDNYYWNIIDSKAINVWIACSDSKKSNGGICYLKGSNKMGTINHELSYKKGSSQQISSKILSNLKFDRKYPSLKAGDCLIHHPEVIHGSLKNKSNKDRIGLAISFKSKYAKINDLKLELYKKKLNKSLGEIYKSN